MKKAKRFMIEYANSILRTLEEKNDIPENYRIDFYRNIDATINLYESGIVARYDAMRTLADYDNRINRFSTFYNVKV